MHNIRAVALLIFKSLIKSTCHAEKSVFFYLAGQKYTFGKLKCGQWEFVWDPYRAGAHCITIQLLNLLAVSLGIVLHGHVNRVETGTLVLHCFLFSSGIILAVLAELLRILSH